MKSRGFTLIELLGVLIILAVLALIATPVVTGIISSSKELTIELSLKSIQKEVDTIYYEAKMNGQKLVNEDIYDSVVENLEGKKPDSGEIYINKNGDYAILLVFNNQYYKKQYTDLEITKVTDGDYSLDLDYLVVEKTGDKTRETTDFLGTPIKRNEIEKLYIVKSSKVPSDALGSFDLSVPKIKSINGWYYDKDGNGLYEFYIGADDGVLANPNSSYLFARLTNLVYIDLSGLDTSKVTNMKYMFYKCIKLTHLDVSGFNTSKVTNMKEMFYNCEKLNSLDLTNFDTLKVTSMYGMFYSCDDLTDLNLSNFNTSNVKNMQKMFSLDRHIENLDISSFDMSNVTETDEMFYNMQEHLVSLKTPKKYPTNSSVTLTLPLALKDSNGNSYTTLSNISPTDTLLKKSW